MVAILRKNIYKIFWVVVFLGLAGVIFNLHTVDLVLKPLIIPCLLAALLLRSGNTKGKKKITAALVFSFLGDVSLMFEDRNPGYFMAGLACFLLTHVLYISYFLQIRQSGPSTAKKHPFLWVLTLLYAAGLLYLLYPGLGSLKIPVMIYAAIISTMMYLSFCIPEKAGRITVQLFITGAVMFVISDSILAVNKFYSPFAAAPALIRITYCLAQYFIVKGFIRKRY